MHVVISGGNSFIGRGLTRLLFDAGDGVTWLSHRPGRVAPPPGVAEHAFDPGTHGGPWHEAVAAADVVVNLSGHPIVSRWNKRVKQRLISSRIETTRALVDAIAMARASGSGPGTFVCASGIGIYGDRGDEVLTEDSPRSDDWLARLAQDWEAAAQRAAAVGCRVVTLRTAPVLGREGLVPRLVLPFRMFVGGPIGRGDQWMPWIHYEDVVGLYVMAVRDARLNGPVNACAPQAVNAREFAAALGRALRRPSWLPLPSFALRIVLGEVARYVLFSQRASCAKALEAGYVFKHPEIGEALEHVVRELL